MKNNLSTEVFQDMTPCFKYVEYDNDLIAAGLPAEIVGSQNFQTFSTRQTPHLVD